MKTLIALFYFALSLYGCDVGSTDVHRIQSGATDILYSKVVTQPGGARFECLRSASGRCHYTLFARDCAAHAGPSDARDGRCAAPLARFALDDGSSRQRPGLQRFRVCVSTDDAPVRADCSAPAPLATR